MRVFVVIRHYTPKELRFAPTLTKKQNPKLDDITETPVIHSKTLLINTDL